MGEVALFGIRHHGPGSAARLVDALEALRPGTVLIEGPADASELLPLLADPAMRTPVALLTYAEADPANASFLPLAGYSPELQAARWAVRHGAVLRFIDLPSSDRLSLNAGETGEQAEGPDENPIARYPIGALAAAAGYDDGESWWSDVIEENPAPGQIFAAVADAMTTLRAESGPPSGREAAREAHMRIEIERAASESDRPVAVVCGAWHVPALAERRSPTADRELLKGRRPRIKTKATWVPWTAARLTRASGYGAGVVAPGWFAHLWQNRAAADRDAVWLGRIGRVLRKRGHVVPTAAVIEARRLGTALAAVRDRPRPGFEELREAVIACLCGGERAIWDAVADELLVGSAVGAIPEATPHAPLLEDLQRQQKVARLEPEGSRYTLAIDLRSRIGLVRSTLLHRLAVLDVPWGRLTDAGSSRGTFRENWMLHWQPELAVRLIENFKYGATIAEAASCRLMEAMAPEPVLSALADLIRCAMITDLPRAVEAGIAALETRTALTSDCGALLDTLPPMADILRYGEARAGTVDHLAALMPRIVVQAALALPYAARNLDEEAAGKLRGHVLAAGDAIELAQLDADTIVTWHDALRRLLEDAQAMRIIAGTAARLLYEAELLDPLAAAELLGRMLSPGVSADDAAGFFEGFLEGAGQRLIDDARLRDAVDQWLLSLDAESFTANLPLFRRVFADLDNNERRQLMDAVLGRRGGRKGYRLMAGAGELWPLHQARVLELLSRGAGR